MRRLSTILLLALVALLSTAGVNVSHRREAFRAAGGGSEPPATNIFAHYKADVGVTKDGSDYVSQWDDQSGNGHHLTQATGSKQPLWESSQINGYPGIHFDGTDDAMKTSTFTSEANATVCVVVEKHSTHTGVIFDGALNNTEVLYFDSAGSRRIRTYAGGYGPWTDSGPETNVWYLVVARFQSSSLARLVCYKLTDDTEPADLLGNIVSPSFTGIAVGANGANTGYYMDGRIAEVLVYNEASSDAKIEEMITYFSEKY